jgi:hypothetical protein
VHQQRHRFARFIVNPVERLGSLALFFGIEHVSQRLLGAVKCVAIIVIQSLLKGRSVVRQFWRAWTRTGRANRQPVGAVADAVGSGRRCFGRIGAACSIQRDGGIARVRHIRCGNGNALLSCVRRAAQNSVATAALFEDSNSSSDWVGDGRHNVLAGMGRSAGLRGDAGCRGILAGANGMPGLIGVAGRRGALIGGTGI